MDLRRSAGPLSGTRKTTARDPEEDVAIGGTAREIAYWRAAEGAVGHGLAKPLADTDAGRLLMEMGAVLSLLPDPPGQVLDLGVGTGWTSAFLARRGYRVTGVEASPDAVEAGRRHFADLASLDLVIGDFQTPVDDVGRFDAALWFDALHHAEDEVAALMATRTALRPGGLCVVCEPGIGHAASASSVAAARMYGVRERDMAPPTVLAAARAAGFTGGRVVAHPHELHRSLYRPYPGHGIRGRALGTPAGQAARALRAILTAPRRWGLVVLVA